MAQSTLVGATVCSGTSTISIDAPVSDSIVTSSSVTISGGVTQSSQIEIDVDGAFDSIIPLTVGQTTYSGTVTIPAGTHTIKVIAISLCSGSNGSSSVVVTYEEPPQAPSTGSSTDTSVSGDSGQPGTATVTQGDTDNSTNTQDPGITGLITLPLQHFAQWLNINVGDTHGTEDAPSLSVGNAVALTAGMYLVAIGIAPSVLGAVASIPLIATALPAATLPGRIRFLGIAGRIIGGVLIIGSLFFS